MRLFVTSMVAGGRWAHLRVTVHVCMRGRLRSGEQHFEWPVDDVKHQGYDKGAEGLLDENPEGLKEGSGISCFSSVFRVCPATHRVLAKCGFLRIFQPE